MSTKQETVDFILSSIQRAGDVSAKKMFGEYGLYCDGLIFGLVCDNQLYIKPTVAGREYWGDVEEAPPYPGAKNYFYISEDNWDDSQRLCELIRIMLPELPSPRVKTKRVRKS